MVVGWLVGLKIDGWMQKKSVKRIFAFFLCVVARNVGVSNTSWLYRPNFQPLSTKDCHRLVNRVMPYKPLHHTGHADKYRQWQSPTRQASTHASHDDGWSNLVLAETK